MKTLTEKLKQNPQLYYSLSIAASSYDLSVAEWMEKRNTLLAVPELRKQGGRMA